MAIPNQAGQSSVLEVLLAQIKVMISIATEFDKSTIIQWWSESRPQYQGNSTYIISYALVDEIPFMYAGAAQLAAPDELILKITVYTRLALDVAGSDDDTATSASRGAFVIRQQIRNYIDNMNIFSSYDWNIDTLQGTGTADGQPLTLRPCQQLPTYGLIEKDKKEDPTFAKSVLMFSVACNRPLTAPLGPNL